MGPRFERRVGSFRRGSQPSKLLSSELRLCLRNLADSINQTVKLLDHFEERFAEPDETRSDVPRADVPGGDVRAEGPLIPSNRSQLMEKINMRPPFGGQKGFGRQNFRQRFRGQNFRRQD
jgi:hypothetical protein